VATTERFQAQEEHVLFMDRLFKKLHKSKRIRVAKKELFAHPRRHHSFSVREVGEHFIATIVYEEALIELSFKRTLSRGEFKRAFKEAFDYAI